MFFSRIINIMENALCMWATKTILLGRLVF